jgi:adenylate cyclase
LLGSAITISPGFAASYALIAYTHAVDYANGWGENPERSLQTSLEIAGRAVQLNEEDPEAHVDFGVALAWDSEHDRALAEARRSIALAPNFARGHLIVGRMLIMSGDAAAAINAIDASMRFDPLYRDITLHYLAEARVSLGQFDAAVAVLKHRLERNPNAQTSLALLACCYGHLGRIAEARAAWAEVMRIEPNFSTNGSDASCHIRIRVTSSAVSRDCEKRIFPRSTSWPGEMPTTGPTRNPPHVWLSSAIRHIRDSIS